MEWICPSTYLSSPASHYINIPPFAEFCKRLILKENPPIKDLRGQARRYKPPFQYIGTEVEVGVPNETQPLRENAYTAFDSDFDGRVVEIKNPKNERSLILRAKGAFPPKPGVNFQVNEKQAIYLFGRVHKTAKAVAFVLSGTVEPRDHSERAHSVP